MENIADTIKVPLPAKTEIEKHFFGFRIERTRAADSLTEFALSMLSSDYTRPRSPTNRNGTEWAVVSAIDEERKAERWEMVIRKTYDRFRFDDQKRKFIELYYFKCRSLTQTCMSLFISDGTFTNWRREIMRIAYLWAIELNLIGENT